MWIGADARSVPWFILLMAHYPAFCRILLAGQRWGTYRGIGPETLVCSLRRSEPVQVPWVRLRVSAPTGVPQQILGIVIEIFLQSSAK